jgi:hypothetical protein
LRIPGVGNGPPSHGQAFLFVKAIQFLLVHREPLPLKQNTNTPKPKLAADAHYFMHLVADIRMIRRALAPHGLGIDTNQVADPALRDFVLPHHPDRRFPPLS